MAARLAAPASNWASQPNWSRLAWNGRSVVAAAHTAQSAFSGQPGRARDGGAGLGLIASGAPARDAGRGWSGGQAGTGIHSADGCRTARQPDLASSTG
jgi:hypothetical protein